ncbi:MAG TPA: hypothetical protein VD793_05560 [Gemmatimonadales bacterium]|nr:hypothetical protein [Gemmatimonadales bacterium]
MLRAALPFRAHAPQAAAPAPSPVHATLPLALFEAVRVLDLPPGADLDAFHRELTIKRLGTSPTVVAQISRYTRLAENRDTVPADELVAVLRLMSRRADASLVFADGGRRAGRRAVRLTSMMARGLWRLLPTGARQGLGFRLAASAARRVLGVDLHAGPAGPEATLRQPLGVQATADGAACAFYGSAVAELLRAFTAFDGALFHVQCCARGGVACRWRAVPGEGS